MIFLRIRGDRCSESLLRSHPYPHNKLLSDDERSYSDEGKNNDAAGDGSVGENAGMKTISLSEIADLEAGSGFPVNYQGETSGDLAFAKVSDISNVVRSGSRHIESAKNYISRQKAKELKAKVFPPGTIVFAKIGESIKGNMRAMTTCEMLFDNNVMGISSTSKEINHIFLFHFLNTLDFYSLANKTSVPALRKSDLQRIQVPFPPIAEQKRIAAILDKAEELRGLRRKALGELDAIVQSIFLKMFGNPLTNPNKFPIQKLGEICSRVMDCPHSTPTYATRNTPYACVRSSDIQNSELVFNEVKYVELEEYKKRIERGAPQLGDVIYCREGARFGNAALVIDNTSLVCLGQRMMMFRPESSKANGEFVWGYLSSPIAYHQALREVGGSASPHINIRDIIAFQIPVPPLIKQQEFARRVQAIEQLKTIHRESLAHLDALFASLQHRAFRGEL